MKGNTVLLVDDDNELLQIYKKILTRKMSKRSITGAPNQKAVTKTLLRGCDSSPLY